MSSPRRCVAFNKAPQNDRRERAGRVVRARQGRYRHARGGTGISGARLESDEVVGESIFDIYAGTPIVDDARRALDGEAVHSTIELDDRIFEGWYRPVENGQGMESQTIGVAIDVTERAERERRFSAVFNNTFQFMALLQPDGTVIEINDTALQFGGNDRTDVVGRPFWEVAPLELSEGTSERVKDAVERAANGESVRFEEEIRAGDDVVTTDTSVKPVANEYDDIEFLVAEGRDITGRKERERELVSSPVIATAQRGSFPNKGATLTEYSESIERCLLPGLDRSEESASISAVVRRISLRILSVCNRVGVFCVFMWCGGR